MAQWLPQSYWWQFLWASVVLAVCTLICLAGSGLFARCSNGLLVILLVAIISIPLSAVIKNPFVDVKEHIVFTGFSLDTFRQNLLPRFTKGAAGSVGQHRENFQDLFGILFPATGGILAGASMSGDLKHPSKAIPKGTLYGLGLTFFLYTFVIFAMAASIGRETFYNNTNVIQLTNISSVVILLGEFATSLFSVLMGVIGSAKLLQALSRDHLIPGLSLFGQGTRKSDEPIYAIAITFVIALVTMFADINQIASFITMTVCCSFVYSTNEHLRLHHFKMFKTLRVLTNVRVSQFTATSWFSKIESYASCVRDTNPLIVSNDFPSDKSCLLPFEDRFCP